MFSELQRLKARTFGSLAEQNEYLLQWEENVADTQIHGITKKQVRQQFEDIERPTLMTLPRRSVFDCVRDFLHDEAFEGHERILNRYLKPDLLILDDMGMKQLPKKSGEFLFEIIMGRHDLRSTMMTLNRPLEDWGKLIGDVPAATAILDRFLESADVIQITGRSFRLRVHRADKNDVVPCSVTSLEKTRSTNLAGSSNRP